MPGYRVEPFVSDFAESGDKVVPRVRTVLGFRDYLGTIRARVGIARDKYKVNPGLYCAGVPTSESPVFVTANYKLSFDALRRELTGINCWLLVVDTRGVNVWCAAGKKTFSADEVARQVKRAGLKEIVSHRELILPQFAAVGVAFHTLKDKCSFKGVFGPVKASDIPQFLKNGKKADDGMRSVTFSLGERVVLVPVEIALTWKMFAIAVLIIFAVSGFGITIYSIQDALARGGIAAGAIALGVLSGGIVVPVLLPWIPGRQFWLKGVLVGIVLGFAYLRFFMQEFGVIEKTGLWILVTSVTSYMAMNFTGATPFTSLSGVKKEMNMGLLVQFAGLSVGLVFWIGAPFLG